MQTNNSDGDGRGLTLSAEECSYIIRRRSVLIWLDSLSSADQDIFDSMTESQQLAALRLALPPLTENVAVSVPLGGGAPGLPISEDYGAFSLA